jgi:hypothetical protein
MKKYVYLLSFFLILCSCQKEGRQLGSDSFLPEGYLEQVKGFLRTRLSGSDYANVDFLRGLLSKQNTNWYLRLAWVHKSLNQDFLLLRTDSLGNCQQSLIIGLDKDSCRNCAVFNGRITLSGLNRQVLMSSVISQGYIEALHSSPSISLMDLPAPLQAGPPYQSLPEVIVVGYLPATSGASPSLGDLVNLEALGSLGYGGGASAGPGAGAGGTTGSGSFGSSGNGTIYGASGSAEVYSPLNGGSGSGIQPSNDVVVNFETSTSLPAINVSAYMQCFSSIPDAGAQCSVTIYADLPVNDNPQFIFNWNSGAVGHSFLQLTKTGTGGSVTQVIGFTASKPFQAMVSPGAVPSKIVDNQGHKFNASLTMNITSAQLNLEIATIEALSTINYDIVNYNCVNFSVQVLNAVRSGIPLVVPDFQIPGASQALSSTPEGLYILLSQMKKAGGPEAGNIITNEILWAQMSHGACN